MRIISSCYLLVIIIYILGLGIKYGRKGVIVFMGKEIEEKAVMNKFSVMLNIVFVLKLVVMVKKTLMRVMMEILNSFVKLLFWING